MSWHPRSHPLRSSTPRQEDPRVETSPAGQKRPQMGSRCREVLHVFDSQVRIETPFSQVSGNQVIQYSFRFERASTMMAPKRFNVLNAIRFLIKRFNECVTFVIKSALRRFKCLGGLNSAENVGNGIRTFGKFTRTL